MAHPALIGLVAGIASGLLLASSAMGGAGGRILLFFLAPLPTYLAGLGWGVVSAVVAATIGGLAAGAALGLKTGLIYLLGHCLPAVILCHLALLARPVVGLGAQSGRDAYPVDEADDGQAALEWYPVGRLVAAATLMAGGLAFLALIAIATDIEQLRALMREFLDKMVLKSIPGLEGKKIGEPELKAMTEMMVFALPAGSAFLWLAGFLLNLWLAGRITNISGQLVRPWPDLASMRFPRRFGLGLAASMAATVFLVGYPRLLASAFSGAFLCAYALMGLAVIHYVTRGSPSRPFVLWGVYLLLFVLNTWAALAIAMIGVLEPLLPWRRPPPPP